MTNWMRCQYCGMLQDEPVGVKACARCGGELAPEPVRTPAAGDGYLQVQMELDQVHAPAGTNVERYLLITLRTPKQVPEPHAVPDSGRPPLHFAPVLDVSGSMEGEKIVQVKQALRQALRALQAGDVLSLVVFSSEARRVVPPTPFTPDLRQKVESLLDEIEAGGMTALDNGLRLGIENAAQERRETNLVMLLSDGQANVGETDLEKVGQRAAHARRDGLLVSTLGVGLDYNEALMVEIANQGGGRFYHIRHASEIPSCLMRELGDAAMVGARQATVELDLPDGATVVSLTSAYPVEQVQNKARVSVGDIPIDIELEVPLRLVLFAQTEGTRINVEGNVRYLSPVGKALAAALNRVSVRFVAASSFQPRQGVVAPVVERIAEYRQAAYLLDYARLMDADPRAAQRLAEQEAPALRAYIGMVNAEKAQELEFLLHEDALAPPAPPRAKDRVRWAAARFRAVRD